MFVLRVLRRWWGQPDAACAFLRRTIVYSDEHSTKTETAESVLLDVRRFCPARVFYMVCLYELDLACDGCVPGPAVLAGGGADAPCVATGVPTVKSMADATGGGGGGGGAVTVTVSVPEIVSGVLPSGSVAVATSDNVAVPAPTLVMIAPFGVLGSAATVNTVSSDEV